MKAYFNGQPLDVVVYGQELPPKEEPIMLEGGVDWVVSPAITFPIKYPTAILSDGKKFVAFGANNKFAYSYDGMHWTAGDLPVIASNLSYQYVWYVNNRFVVFHQSSNSTYMKSFLWSDNGIDWNICTLPKKPQYGLMGVAYGNGTWVLCFSSDYLFKSTDFVNWEEVPTEDLIGMDANTIAYFKGNFYITSQTASNKIGKSSDLINWEISTLTPLNTGSTLAGWLTATENVLMCCSMSPKLMEVAYTTDGVNWKHVNLLELSKDNAGFSVNGLSHVNNRWYIYGSNTSSNHNYMYYCDDTDLDTWHKTFYPDQYIGEYGQIAYKDGLYIMANDFDTPAISFTSGRPKKSLEYKNINVSVDNPDHGSVSGKGVASRGMYVRVSAESNTKENWGFTHWTEDGQEVSRANPYYFTVTKDRNLVANFNNLYLFGRNWFTRIMRKGSITAVADANVAATQLEFNPHNGYFYLVTLTDTNKPYVTKDFKEMSVINGNTKLGSNCFISFDVDGNCYGIYSTSSAQKIWISYADSPTGSEYTTNVGLPQPTVYVWCSVAYNNGMWVVTANNSPGYIYSRDGEEWTFGTAPDKTSGSIYRKLKVIDGKFMYHIGSKLYFSEDGINWTALNTSKTIVNIFWDGTALVTVHSNVVCRWPEYDPETVETYNVSASSSKYLLGGMYADGMYLFYTKIAANSHPKFWYGESLSDLKQTEEISDVSWSAAVESGMVGAYGNGMAVVIATKHRDIIYTHPGLPED